MPGWRMGYVVGPESIIEMMETLQQFIYVCAPAPFQQACAAELDYDVSPHIADYHSKRDLVYGGLKDHFELVKPGGAFYTFPNLTGLLGRDLGGRTAGTTMELAALLLDEIKIAVVPGEAFGAPGYARLSFALADEDLEEGLTRLIGLAT